MRARGHKETRSHDDTIADIWEIRSRMADRGLIFYAIAGLPSAGISINRAFETGWHHVYTYHVVLAALTIIIAVLRKHLPYIVRAGWLISLSFLAGVAGMLVFGPASASIIAFTVFPVLAAISLGIRSGLIASGFSLIVLAIVSVATLTGHLNPAFDMAAYIKSPSYWGNYLMAFVLWIPPVVIALGVVYGNLVNSLELLQKSQGVRKRLFESSKVPTVVMTVDTYAFVDCNPAAVAVFGFSSEEDLLGKTPIDVSPEFQPDGTLSAEGVRSNVSRAIEDEDIQFEWQHKQADGAPLDAEIHLMHFEADGQDLLQCTVMDVTRRKKAESASRQSQKRYQSVFNHAGDAIFLLKDGRFVECNPTTQKMFGATPEQIVGNTPQGFSPEYQPCL